MKSFTTLTSLFTNLSNNTSTANTALGGQLINDNHRYLLQKYFDNERTYTTTTIGAMNLTLTGSLAIGAVSATLSSAWTYQTVSQLVNFSSGNQRSVLFTNGSTAITWTTGLIATATTAIATVGVQAYPIPPNISKITNDTITVGQLRFVPAPIQSRTDWDRINFLPYTSDIPNYYYIYNNQVNFWPIPSTTGNIISFNYKARVADLTYSDYSTGTLNTAGMVVGSTAVTGLSTLWASGTFPVATDISFQNLKIIANPPNGDGIWYPIQSFTDATHLVLQQPVVNAPNIANTTTYTIGQFPLLGEDFHDMLVYYALSIYHTSIKKDVDKYKLYQGLYDQKLELLEGYESSKSVNVDLGATPIMSNPNQYIYAQS